MRNRVVVSAPFVGLGNGLGFGGAERVAVFVENTSRRLRTAPSLAGGSKSMIAWACCLSC